MEKRQGKPGSKAIVLALLAGLLLLTACAPATSTSTLTPTFATTLAPSPTVIPPTPSSTQTVTPVPTATPVLCLETQGKIEEFTIPAESLPADLMYWVYTPPCYDDMREVGYPVVYELHGQGSTPQQWVDLGLIDAADRLIRDEVVPPFIIVMPYEKSLFDNPYTSGFMPALIDELVPAIDASYNTCTDAGCRVLAGISRGGGWALYIGYLYPELFGVIAGHSAVPFTGVESFISRSLESHEGVPLPRMKIDIGRSDNWLSSALPFIDYLIAKEIPHEFEMDAGYHDDVYWQRHIENYLRWYFEAPLLQLATATLWPTIDPKDYTPTP